MTRKYKGKIQSNAIKNYLSCQGVCVMCAYVFIQYPGDWEIYLLPSMYIKFDMTFKVGIFPIY